MRTALLTLSAALTLTLMGCSRSPEPDAYGNFEATDVVVAAETNGRILVFAPREGDRLPAGQLAAVIDTTQLVLEREQMAAQRSATASRSHEVAQELDALRVQHEIAGRNYERMGRLFEEKAATAQQRDQAERDYRVLREQMQAARAQQRTVALEAASTEARVAQIRDHIRRSRVVNPLAGSVLATYAEAGEFVQTGQPLYRIANLDSMILRAYVTEPQLASVGIGRPARVTVDVGKQRRTLPGTVAWVASEAEFTPTPIQTRDERADLVYAVKIRVANEEGMLKIGMPADVRFTPTPAAP